MVSITGGAGRHWHERTSLAPSILKRVYMGRHSLKGKKYGKHELESAGSRPDFIRIVSERMILFSLVREFISGQRRFGWVSLGKYHSMYASRSRTAKASMYY